MHISRFLALPFLLSGCFLLMQLDCPDTDEDGFLDHEGEGTVLNKEKECYRSNDLPPDCDDTDPEANPDAIEVCDEVDNNCDGVVDEDCLPTI